MKIIRPKAVIEATGLSRTTIWRLERRGDFPKRIRLGPNSTGWLEADIEQWIASRPRGLSVSVGWQEFEKT
jgi:prophage regulatory protein